jgi:cytochrome c peroxidase
MLATRAILLITTLLACQPAFAQSAKQIEHGRQLFFKETFEGNGRTCGTCHPATNNFTLDPAFVRALPRNDPLFVIRSTPELADLEIRRFLREGTILENVDGFANPGVMRGVPHTLALSTSTDNGATGWSGDGSPGNLRDFATGAVTQHFPKTLARRACTLENFDPNLCDFRLPTSEELDAMEAFQLSLGRQQEIDLATLPEFADDTVELGRALFQSAPARDGSTRACTACHTNGGTNDGDFDTGVAKLPNAPACRVRAGRGIPGDGGRGPEVGEVLTRAELCNSGAQQSIVFRGNGRFNTPPAIEAADTPPFFHNDTVATLEGSVAFYTTDTFNDSPAGRPNRAFVLDGAEVNAIAAFLRALNSMENIRSASAFSSRALDPAELAPAAELVNWALAETTDAVEVLTQGPLKLFPDAVTALEEAQDFERQALAQDPPNADLLQDAIAALEAARELIFDTPVR